MTEEYIHQPIEEWKSGKCHGCGNDVGKDTCICIKCIKGVKHEDWDIKPIDCKIQVLYKLQSMDTLKAG